MYEETLLLLFSSNTDVEFPSLINQSRRKNMALKGSKTEQNLKDAFAGESQANRRYLYFAAKADVEGYNDVSTVFRSRQLKAKPVTHTATWNTSKKAVIQQQACLSAVHPTT
jgi:hypothetical protein